MRHILLCVLLICVFAAVAQARTFVVPDEFPTIRAANNLAGDGDTIQINPGIYNEEVTLGSDTNIIGAGADKVIIRGKATSKDPVLGLGRVSGVVISGCTFEQVDMDKAGSKRRFGTGYIFDSSAEIRDCQFLNSGTQGIYITGKSNVRITQCQVINSAHDGICISGQTCEAVIDNNEITATQGYGAIAVREGAQCTVERNSLRENDYYGILILDAGTSTTVQENTCSQNGSHGIYLSAGASAKLRHNICTLNEASGIHLEGGVQVEANDNVCKENGEHGISISFPTTIATLQSNTCCSNKKNGIEFQFGAKGSAISNICEENAGAGITVRQWETAPLLAKNQCKRNTDGISFESGCQGTAEENICQHNGRFGILVTDEGSQPELNGNDCELNDEGSVQEIEGTPAARQEQVNVDVSWLLAQGQFDRLETLAINLRNLHCVAGSGNWELRNFYEWVTKGMWGFAPSKRKEFLDAFARWQEAYPKSVTPRIAEAIVHVNYAWDARGGGYANTVTDEAWRRFFKELDEADSLLLEAERLSQDDPHLYETMLRTLLGKSTSKTQMEDVLQKGVAITRDYDHLYRRATIYLLPRWHGSAGEVVAFAERAADMTRETRGEAMYAVVASAAVSYVGGDEVSSYGFSWPDLQKAFADLLEQHPDANFYRNAYCLIACYNDPDTARKLFEDIGDDWDEDVWHQESEFLRLKALATAPDASPLKAAPFTEPIRQTRFYISPFFLNLAGALVVLIVVAVRAVVKMVRG